MRTSVDDAVAALGVLAEDDVTAWTDGQVREGLLAMLVVYHQLTAVISTMVGSFDTRELSGADGCRTARTWLTAFGRMSQGAATGWLSRARLMRQLPALAAGALAGQVSAEHLRKVADLVDHIGIDAVRDFDDILAGLAAQVSPAETQVACERIRAHVDPDGPDPDPKAAQRRGISISRVGSLFTVSGRLDAEGGSTLLTALDALMGKPAPDDTRTAPQRRADALVELGRRALITGDLPTVGGVRPQLGILLTPEALLGTDSNSNPDPDPDPDVDSGAGSDPAASDAASLPEDALGRAGVPMPPEAPSTTWKARLPAHVAQRIACDADVWRIVLDPATGLPLDVGRTHRIVPYWIRKALQARDRGCRWKGCDVPAQWCEVHHTIPWYYNGQSNVDLCLLLCRYHHGLVHHENPAPKRWRLKIDRTNGNVHIYRPDGSPYELGPHEPYRGPTPRPAPPPDDGPPDTKPPNTS